MKRKQKKLALEKISQLKEKILSKGGITYITK